MHVRGFTKHASSKVGQPGTYIGLVEKLAHLKVRLLLILQISGSTQTHIYVLLLVYATSITRHTYVVFWTSRRNKNVEAHPIKQENLHLNLCSK